MRDGYSEGKQNGMDSILLGFLMVAKMHSVGISSETGAVLASIWGLYQSGHWSRAEKGLWLGLKYESFTN